MNSPVPPQGSWDKVEKTTSFCLLIVLVLFIGSRLGAIGFRRSSPKLHRPVALTVLGALAIMLIVRSFV